MGPLADWDARTDILSELDRSDFYKFSQKRDHY